MGIQAQCSASGAHGARPPFPACRGRVAVRTRAQPCFLQHQISRERAIGAFDRDEFRCKLSSPALSSYSLLCMSHRTLDGRNVEAGSANRGKCTCAAIYLKGAMREQVQCHALVHASRSLQQKIISSFAVSGELSGVKRNFKSTQHQEHPCAAKERCRRVHLYLFELGRNLGRSSAP